MTVARPAKLVGNDFTQRTIGVDRSAAIRALTGGQPVVYALRLSDGVIKIGCSEHLELRRKNVEAGAQILAFRPGTLDDEKAIHATLVPHRARGFEFYHPTPEVIDVVNEMREHFNLPPLES